MPEEIIQQERRVTKNLSFALFDQLMLPAVDGDHLKAFHPSQPSTPRHIHFSKIPITRVTGGLAVTEEVRMIEGPNLYCRAPVVMMNVAEGHFEDAKTIYIKNFNSALLKLLPGIEQYPGTPNQKGGFLRDLEEGLSLLQVTKQVAIYLLDQAGIEMDYKKAQKTDGFLKSWFFLPSPCLEATRYGMEQAIMFDRLETLRIPISFEPYNSYICLLVVGQDVVGARFFIMQSGKHFTNSPVENQQPLFLPLVSVQINLSKMEQKYLPATTVKSFFGIEETLQAANQEKLQKLCTKLLQQKEVITQMRE